MVKSEYSSAQPFMCQDGTLTRNLMHPDIHGTHNASLVETVVPPLERSALVRHEFSDAIYHFIEGRGSMRIGERVLSVEPRDTVYIPMGQQHQVENSGDCFLRILCFAVPAARDADKTIV